MLKKIRKTIAFSCFMGILLLGNPLIACCQCYCWVSPTAGEHCVYNGEPQISQCVLFELAGHSYCKWGDRCDLTGGGGSGSGSGWPPWVY